MSRINYDRRGEGSPLVLVHGLGSRWQIWEPLLDALARSYDVISVDLPGFGSSPLPTDFAPSIPAYASRLEEFFVELGIERPALAGNSMGGAISIELGRRGSASRVTAYSPAGFWNALELRWCETVFRTARALGERARPVVPSLVQNRFGRIGIGGVMFARPAEVDPTALFGDTLGLLDAPGLLPALASFRSYNLCDPHQDWGALRDIPVTIAWGSRDHLLTYRSQSSRARRAMPWADHVTLPRSGHVPFYDDPDRCSELLTYPVRRPRAAS